MNSTNPNPYPTGRWSQPSASHELPPPTSTPRPGPLLGRGGEGEGASTPAKVEIVRPPKRSRRAVPKLEPGLLGLPLKQLFWGVTESQMLEEAGARIENAIRTFLVREALLDCEFQV
jgi:hypothetical protein